MDGRVRKLLKCKSKYEGLVFEHKLFGKYTVIKYNSGKDVEIEFERTKGKLVTSMNNIQKGSVRDGMAATVLGVGITGGLQVRFGDKYDPAYNVWKAMLVRCYSEGYLKRFPSYIGCEVSDYFKFYPNFKNWYYSQENLGKTNLELDKDILIKGNKVYSPNTCCLVPLEVNTALTLKALHRGEFPLGVSYKDSISKYSANISEYGESKHIGYFFTQESAFEAYKVRKETYLKALADKWKDCLTNEAYLSLKTWGVTEYD